ncbi:7tm 7 and/or Lig chan domain containing protein, partial [Asbolus verrucosus]
MGHKTLKLIFFVGRFLAITPSFIDCPPENFLRKVYSTFLCVLLTAGAAISIYNRRFQYSHYNYIKLTIKLLMDASLHTFNCYTMIAVFSNRLKWWKLMKKLKISPKSRTPWYMGFVLTHTVYWINEISLTYVWTKFGTTALVKQYLIEIVQQYSKFLYSFLIYTTLKIILFQYETVSNEIEYLTRNLDKSNFLFFLTKHQISLIGLKETVELFNNIFGWPILIIIVYAGLQILLYLDMVISNPDRRASNILIADMTTVVIYCVGTIVIILTCDSISQQNEKILRSCGRFEDMLMTVGATNECKLLKKFLEVVADTAKSLRLVMLQAREHKHELRDLAEFILSHINNYGDTFTEIQVEEMFLVGNTTKSTRFDTAKTHVLIVWSMEVLVQFLDYGHQMIIPRSRDFYNFFFASQTSTEAKFFAQFWVQFGVLNLCWCSAGNNHIYFPFYKNRDGTWGTTQNRPLPKIKDFNQYPLKVSMFIRNPTAIVELPKLLKEDPVYSSFTTSHHLVGGLDGLILNTLAEHLNFSVEIVGGLNKESFGKVLRNGTITGSLGVVVNHQVHISTNGRFLIDYKTNEIEFTAPYGTDSICAIVPKSKKVPQWLTIFNCFNKTAWSAIYFVYFFSTMVWHLMQPDRKLSKKIWDIFAVVHGIPVKIKPTVTQAFFLMWCMIFNIIIQGLVQGSLFQSITTPFYYKDIDTLQELDDADFPIATNFFNFDNDSSKLMSSLKRKTVKSGPQLFDMVAYRRNTAKLERKNDVAQYIKIHYLDEDGTPLIHLVNECLNTYFVSYIVPRGSPFLKIFNSVILKLFEGGLTLKWYKDVEYSMRLEKLINLYKNETSWMCFHLDDLQGAFYLLALAGIIYSVYHRRYVYYSLTSLQLVMRITMDATLYAHNCHSLTIKRQIWSKLLKKFGFVHCKSDKGSHFTTFILAHVIFCSSAIFNCYVWFSFLGWDFFKMYLVECFQIYSLFFHIVFAFIVLKMLLVRYQQQALVMTAYIDRKDFFSEEVAKFLGKIRRDLSILKEISEIFSEIFGWAILLKILFGAAKTLLYLDIVLENTYHVFKSFDVAWNMLHFLSNVSVILTFWVGFLAAVLMCHSVVTKFDEILALAYRLEVSSTDSGDIHNFICSIVDYRPHFTAARFFSIDRSIIFSVLNSITTFFIVIIQLKLN